MKTLNNILTQLVLWANPHTPLKDKIAYTETEIKRWAKSNVPEKWNLKEYQNANCTCGTGHEMYYCGCIDIVKEHNKVIDLMNKNLEAK